MKTLLALLLCLGMLLGKEVYSQQDSVKGKVEFDIKVDVLCPTVFYITDKNIQENYRYDNLESVTFEACFNRRQSLQLTGLFETSGGQGYAQTLHIIPEYKYFLSKKNYYTGFYLGIYLTYIRQKDVDEWDPPNYVYTSYYNGYGAGGICGYQRCFFNHLILDFIIDLGESEMYYDSKNLMLDGRIALDIGYKF
jgi:hypothetical protein